MSGAQLFVPDWNGDLLCVAQRRGLLSATAKGATLLCMLTPCCALLCPAVPAAQERDQLSATAEGASRLRFKLGELAQVCGQCIFSD